MELLMVERNYDREVAVDVLVEEAVDGAALFTESPPRWRSLSQTGKGPTAMVPEPVWRMPGRNKDAGYQIVERIEGALHAALLVPGCGVCCCTDEAKVQIYHQNKQAGNKEKSYVCISGTTSIYKGLVRVSGIDYIISVNSIFISTRMTGQEV